MLLLKNSIDCINETCIVRNNDVELDQQQYNLLDHDYISNATSLSSFSEEAIIYKSGFVAHQLETKIKCDVCVNALYGERTNYLKSLINMRDNGGLTYPSYDVIKLCIQTEKNMRSYHDSKPINKNLIINKTLNCFINNSEIFKSIELHNYEYGPETNHVILLMKSIISAYFNLQTNYLCKKKSEVLSIRNWYNKMVLFKGQ